MTMKLNFHTFNSCPRTHFPCVGSGFKLRWPQHNCTTTVPQISKVTRNLPYQDMYSTSIVLYLAYASLLYIRIYTCIILTLTAWKSSSSIHVSSTIKKIKGPGVPPLCRKKSTVYYGFIIYN